MEEVGTMSNTQSNYNLNRFKSNDILANSLANRVYSILRDSIQINNRATLLVSGGNTPVLFFEKLSFYGLDWSKVDVGLVDERCVDTKNKDSNENLVKNHLLTNEAKKANFIGMFSKDFSIDVLNKTYEENFAKGDVLVLGMGNDGHTASIFPELDNLNEVLNSNKFCEITKPKNAPYERITLTLNSILNAKNIFLHIEGQNKIEVFNKALENENVYPISKILFNDKKTIEVYSYE